MDAELRTQREQVVNILRMLQPILVEIRKAFVHQQEQALDQVTNDTENIIEETAFIAAEADEMMIGRLLRDREPLLGYQDILRFLRMIVRDVAVLAEILRHQIHESVPFSDKMMEQANLLLGRQEMLLHSVAGMVGSGETERSREITRICSWMGQHCLAFANHHESRLVEGILPASAPIFLDFLNRMQALVHHELELIRLLTTWIDGTPGGAAVQEISIR